ncbi:trigger factor [Candidatus Uhrbacteria bacterium]|nr:trigger factor [Candidatus Uhrbacteria bacterium]
MTQIKIDEKEKALVKLTFTVTQEEARPYLEEAAKRLSKQTPISGFRPGMASFEIVKQRFGDMKILEEALESIIRKSFVEAVLANNIETVGSPKIDVEKLAPGNDIIFTAEVTRMPKVLSLTDYTKLSVDAKPAEITQKDIDLAIRDIQRMQTKEIRAQSTAEVGAKDKVVLSMNIKKGGVAIEGGQSPNHAIYLTEDYYIPGLKEKLIGMKEGEQKTFTLPFPKEHVQKMLAGSDVDFDITIKEIYNLEPTTIDDVFATSLGMKDLSDLREMIEKNMKEEKELEEQSRQEKEVLELVSKKSQFEEIPDLLLNEEINRMIEELKRNVESQGVEFETYVSNLKKTLSQLKIDFTPQAITRIKVALALRAVAEKEKIQVEEKEIDAELDRIADHYEDQESKKRIYEPSFREYAEQMLRNRKVITLLKQKMVKI